MPDFSPLRSMVALFLVDEITFRAPTAPEFDVESGTYPDEAGGESYSGPCRITPSGGARVVEVGEDPTSLRLFDVTLPWDATGVELNHLGVVGSSLDPHLPGRTVRVVDVQGESDAAYRRLVCEEILTESDGAGS